jgi:hypothetical protein
MLGQSSWEVMEKKLVPSEEIIKSENTPSPGQGFSAVHILC